MSQRKRGSIVDTVNLSEVVFQYEPKVRTKESTVYAKQNVIGARLPSTTWVGGGSYDSDIDIYLTGPDTVDDLLSQIQDFVEPQDDINAPHPVYLNIGSAFIGRVFVLLDMDVVYVTYEYASAMRTAEAKVKLRFSEIPSSNNGVF